MKRIFLSACLLSGYATFAQQDLAYKIPEQAGAVVTVRGNKLLELLSASEFNNSEIGKKILKKMSRKIKKGQITGVDDFGINLASNVYYYNMQTDSIGYNCILLPLNDAAKFERLLDEKNKITKEGAFSKLYADSEDLLMTWNNEMAYIVIGDLKRYYFEDSTRAARYGIKEVSYSDYYYNEDDVAAADTTVAVVDYVVAEPAAVEPGIVEAVPMVEAMTAEAADPELESREVAEAPPAYEDIPADAPAPPMVVADIAMPSDYSAYNKRHDDEAYEKASDEQRRIKQELCRKWIDNFAAKAMMQTAGSPSILNNAEFMAKQDKNATATLYLRDIGNLYRGIFPYFSYRYFAQPLEGYKSMNAQLYMDKEQMRITSNLTLDDKKAASYKKLYGHKLNSKFAKYVNSDKLIGFVSYSFDTEEYLKELPQLLNYAYSGYSGGYMSKYKEELDIASDLLSLMLDEKAIAKVVKGDALLMITDVAQKEYTYKTYEYNDDYERKEIERTKKETLPEFLFMMSSEDTRIIERLLNYGMHKQVINLKNGIYTLDRDISKSPMNVHLLIKDGIVFCGTSLKDIQDISLDRFQGNISKEQKKLLTKNNMTAFFNPKQLAGKIPLEEFHSRKRLDMFNYWMNGTGKFYAKTTGIKGNQISGEMVAEVPEGKENALKYFFSLIESASKMD